MMTRDKYTIYVGKFQVFPRVLYALESSCPRKHCQHPVNSFFTTYLRNRHWESQWKIPQANSCLPTQCFAPCWDTGRTSCAA